MFKKEFKDTMRVLLESSLLLLSIPVVMLVSLLFGLEAPTEELIISVALLTVFAFSGYSGLTLFRAEKRDKGFEYVLSLPISHCKLFLYKIAPRFILLLIILAIGMIFLNMSFIGVGLPLVGLQIGAAFLSLAVDSYYFGIIGLFLLGFFYSLFNQTLELAIFVFGRKGFTFLYSFSPIYISMLLLGIPLGISFFLALKKLDFKSYKQSLKPYLYIALPVLLLQAVIFLIFYEKYRYSF